MDKLAPDGSGSRLRPAHHHPRRGYRNPWPSAQRQGPRGGFLRWMFERRRRPPGQDPLPSSLPRVGTVVLPQELGQAEIAATWLGHSTVLLQAGGVTVLTDPVWAERASPLRFAGPRRWVAPPLAIDCLPRVDIVLQSHNHYDHFDHAATRALARRFPDAVWCLPLGLAGTAMRLGVRVVREMDWEQRVDLALPTGPVGVTAVPAQHFSARGLHDRDRTLWTGFVVSTPAGRLYYAGDTGLHPEFGRIAAEHGPFALTVLPIGAYEPRWFMRPVHLNPEDALEAWRALTEAQASAHLAPAPPLLGVHWGTYKLTDEPMDEPPRRMRDLWRQGGWDDQLLWVLAHGETRRLDKGAHP